jgi:hypothetical protein
MEGAYMSLKSFHEVHKAYTNEGSIGEEQPNHLRARLGLAAGDIALNLFTGRATTDNDKGARQLISVFTVVRESLEEPNELHIIQADDSEADGVAIAQREHELNMQSEGILEAYGVKREKLRLHPEGSELQATFGSFVLEHFDIDKEAAPQNAVQPTVAERSLVSVA